MTRAIRDPDVGVLATLSATLQTDYATDELDWIGSPFGWIKSRPSRQVGSIGERLVAGWLAAKDFDVIRCPDSEADRVINGRRAEIKFSTRWKSGIYKFQQLRDQNYAFVICLGLSPFDAHCWVIPKGEIVVRWKESIRVGRVVDGIQPQHGGGDGRDTAWLTIQPDDVPEWLGRHGGRLKDAATCLRRVARR